MYRCTSPTRSHPASSPYIQEVPTVSSAARQVCSSPIEGVRTEECLWLTWHPAGWPFRSERVFPAQMTLAFECKTISNIHKIIHNLKNYQNSLSMLTVSIFEKLRKKSEKCIIQIIQTEHSWFLYTLCACWMLFSLFFCNVISFFFFILLLTSLLYRFSMRFLICGTHLVSFAPFVRFL